MCMTTDNQTMLKLQHFLKATCMMTIALTAFGCSDDDPAESPQKDITTITASIEGISTYTRTSITESGKGVWNKNDAFGIFHIPTGKSTPNITKFTCPNADGTSSSVTFTGKLEGGATPSYAVYPHQDKMSINETTVTMELPEELTYTEASNGPMYADASRLENDLIFKHLTGLLKLKTGSNVPTTANRSDWFQNHNHQPETSRGRITNLLHSYPCRNIQRTFRHTAECRRHRSIYFQRMERPHDSTRRSIFCHFRLYRNQRERRQH